MNSKNNELPMKIAMIASTYPRYETDGAARFNHSLAEELVALGHEVHVIVPYSPLIKPFATPVNIHVFHYIWPSRFSTMGYAQAMQSDRRLKRSVILLAPLFFLMGLIKLWQVVNDIQADVIHAHWVIPNGFIAGIVSRLSGKPLFVSLHGSDIFFARQYKLLGSLASWVFKQTAGVTACSPELYEGAVALQADSKKLHLLPWGASPALSQNGLYAAEPLRSKFGLTSKTRVIMGLGRLVGKKGFTYLIEALGDLETQFPDVCVVLVGDGPERTALQKQAKQLNLADKVIFTGTVDWTDVPAYLAFADIFVMPSIHDHGNVDGLPTVILEAMALGKPVVASAVGGIPLVIQHGHNGYLFPERDVESLTNYLANLLMSVQLINKFGATNRRLVEYKFNWKNVAASFIDMYQHRDLALEVPVLQTKTSL